MQLSQNTFENSISIGPFLLDKDTRRFYVDKKLVFLRNREFSLMEFFLTNPGKVLTRTLLLEEVWDRNICCNTNTVDVHVSILRRKINRIRGYDVIKTVFCIGYIFEF